MSKYYSLLLLLWLLGACKSDNQAAVQTKNTSSVFKYARHISVADYDGFKLLNIRNAYPQAPDYKYVLKQKLAVVPDSLKALPVIKVPVKRLVVTSTTHLPALVMLGLTDRLVGFPHTAYISNPGLRQKVATGDIKDVGMGRQLNTEILLQLHPDVLMRFSSGQDQNNDAFLQENGIPVLYNADWMEQNPLGRAEWLKLFGLLFHKEAEANRIFDRIVQRYDSIKQSIDPTLSKPLVFQGGVFGDKWFVPGGRSYAAQLIKDAGGQYMWQDDTHTGSVTLNFENVILKLPKAGLWLNPGMFDTMEELGQVLPAVKAFKVFKNKRIYTYSLTKGPTGGILYFEESNAHPDRVLSDLFQIFYPEKAGNEPLYYYKVLPGGE